MQSLVLFLKKKNKWNLCRPPLKGYLWPNMRMTYHRISCSKNTRTPLSYRSISKPLRLIFWPCYKLLIPNIHRLQLVFILQFLAYVIDTLKLFVMLELNGLPSRNQKCLILFVLSSQSASFLCIMSLSVFFLLDARGVNISSSIKVDLKSKCPVSLTELYWRFLPLFLYLSLLFFHSFNIY